jgi:hypothetical protein
MFSALTDLDRCSLKKLDRLAPSKGRCPEVAGVRQAVRPAPYRLRHRYYSARGTWGSGLG